MCAVDRRSRRWFTRALATLPVGAAATGLLAGPGCSPAAAPPTPTRAAAPQAPPTPVVVTTELIVGRNRFSLALIDEATGAINDGVVKVRFYKVDQRAGTGVLKAEMAAPFHGEGLEDKGVYVAYPEFDEPGQWGLEVLTTPKGREQTLISRTNLTVARQGQTPPVGGAAPASRQVLVGEPGIATICSASPQCDMHSVRIADSIAAGRASVVLFAAPGWCPSLTCAPQLNVIQQLQTKFRGQLDFIHVEIYEDAAHTKVVDTLREWRLQTEPWTFVINRQGAIHAKFEGGATAAEIEPFLNSALA